MNRIDRAAELPETKTPITQAMIDSLQWFHEFEFANGMKAKTSHDMQRPFFASRQAFLSQSLKSLDFAGKSVIDIGCWDGYYSFICEQMGAASVLAVDQSSQNWGAKDCFLLARELNGSNVELLNDISVYEIEKRLLGRKFDMVLFLGVFYHLHAPYVAFSQLRSLCHEQTIVAMEGACIRDEERSYAEIVMDDPSKEKFIPSTKLLRDMLRSCYMQVEKELFLNDFAGQDLVRHMSEDDVFEVLRRNVKLQRQEQTSIHEPTAAGKLDRVFLTARPFVGENKCHYYEPPFELVRFDLPQRFE